MKTSILWWFKILLLTAALCASFTEQATPQEKKIICYYTNWSRYRSESFKTDNIPNLCTHYVYAFARVTPKFDIIPTDKYADIDLSGYSKFVELRRSVPDIKMLISLGGSNHGSKVWFDIIKTRENRALFIKNVFKFVRGYGFDGVDLDLQFNSYEVLGRLYNKFDYSKLVEELREEARREREESGAKELVISVILPAESAYDYDFAGLSKSVDWLTLLGYKYFSYQDKITNHISPLYSDDSHNLNHTINYFISNGAVREKLVMSIPLFGHSYTLKTPSQHTLRSPAIAPGNPGVTTKTGGTLAYHEICQLIIKDGWEFERPEGTGPYAYKDNQWVGFDDAQMVETKAEYVKDKELGGVMFWSMDLDDFKGVCNKGSFPLIKSARKVFGKRT